QSEAELAGTATGILMNCKAGVEPLALDEIAAERGAGTFGRDEQDVDLLGRNDAGLIGIDNAEPMRERQRLARSEQGLQSGPLLFLSGVGEQINDDSAAFCCFL